MIWWKPSRPGKEGGCSASNGTRKIWLTPRQMHPTTGSSRRLPTRSVHAQLPQDPFRAHDPGKEEPVTHTVQRGAQRDKPLRGGPEHVFQAIAPGEHVAGGQIKPAPTQRVIVRNVG